MASLLDDIVGALSDTPDPMASVRIGAQMDVVGDFLRSASHLQFGEGQRAAADFQAAQLRQNASDAAAAGERTAWSVDQQAQYLSSRAIAVAAASGGARDPTVVNVVSKMAAMGAYQKALALYGGQDRERLMNLEAEGAEMSGRTAQGQSDLAAFAAGLHGLSDEAYGKARAADIAQRTGRVPTLLSSYGAGSTLLSRFGVGGPRIDATPNSIY